MTWTYSPPTGNPPEWPSLKDQVRYLLGDRSQQAWSPSDEDIAGAILLWNDAYPQHANNAYGIAASIAVSIGDWVTLSGVNSESKSVGNSSLSKSYGDRAAGWRRLASRLAGSSPVPIPGATMGGFGLAAGSDTPERLFRLGQFDNGYQRPGTSLPSHLDRGR